MIRLAAIADDFTGATDLATTLRERGLRVAVVLGPDAVAAASEDLDVIVVALKSRTAPVTEAVLSSVDAVRALAARKPDQYFVKYCSTFDSTPKGNIGPVLDAVLDELGERRTVVVPSFPDNARTVEHGVLAVHGVPLSESSMRHHPLTPMTESRIATILAPQTLRSIAEVDLDVVHEGADGLRAALDRLADDRAHPATYLVVDAVTNDDLATIQDATADWRVRSGSAGLAFGMHGPHDPARQRFAPPEGRRLVVCGSASATTRRQIATALERGAEGRQLDIAALREDPDGQVVAALDWLRELPDSAVPVVYATGSLADLRLGDDGAAGAAIEGVLSQVAVQAVDGLGVRRIIVAGGETSGAVTTALGCRELLIGPQIAPGVCWSVSETADGTPVALALKSGNFGADDLFVAGWEELA